MAATYTPVSIAEMRELFDPAKGWKEEVFDNVNEHVFVYRSKKNPRFIVKVYTSIPLEAARGRGCGEDAIRVCGVRTNHPNTYEGRGAFKAARVHRTKNWRDNLRKRVEDALKHGVRT